MFSKLVDSLGDAIMVGDGWGVAICVFVFLIVFCMGVLVDVNKINTVEKEHKLDYVNIKNGLNVSVVFIVISIVILYVATSIYFHLF